MKKKVGIAITTIIALIIFILIGLKNITILRYGLLFVTIMSGASFLSYIFNKKYEQTIILSILFMIIILYCFGIFGILKIGAYFILISYNLLALVVFIKVLLKKEINKYFKKIISPGVIIFTLLFIGLACTTFNKMFTVWDEYTYWSLANKNMFYLNDFVTNENSTLTLLSPSGVYPPSPTILQYFFCKVIGIYSQGIELFTVQILGFAFLINVFKNLKTRNLAVILSIAFSIIAIPAIFCDQQFYITIYVDAILGIMIGYIFFEFFTSDRNDKFIWLAMYATSIILALTKPTGIVILLIVCSCLGLFYLINKIVNINKNNIKTIIKNIFIDKTLYLVVGMFIIGILFYGSWQLYTKSKIEVKQEVTTNSSYDGNPIIYVAKVFAKACYSGSSESENMRSDMGSVGNAAKDFLDKAYYSTKPFDMSASTWIAITIIGLIIIYNLLNDKKEKQEFLTFSICVMISQLLYMLFLQVAYILVFHNKEGIGHNSLQRYLGTYLMATLIFVVFTFINYINKDKIKYTKSKFVILAAIIFIFTPMEPIFNNTITSGTYNIYKRGLLEHDMWAANYVTSVVNKEDKIYPVHQTGNSDTYGLRFRYFMTPIKTADIKMFNEDEKEKLNLEDWKLKLFEEYNYVYVLNSDEYFNNNYNSIFENGQVNEWTLYKISKDDGIENLKLIPVN